MLRDFFLKLFLKKVNFRLVPQAVITPQRGSVNKRGESSCIYKILMQIILWTRTLIKAAVTVLLPLQLQLWENFLCKAQLSPENEVFQECKSSETMYFLTEPVSALCAQRTARALALLRWELRGLSKDRGASRQPQHLLGELASSSVTALEACEASGLHLKLRRWEVRHGLSRRGSLGRQNISPC